MAMKAEKGRVSIMTKQQKKTLNLVLTYLVIILIGCVLLFPIAWMISAAFKTNDEIFGSIALLPKSFRFQNFIDGWKSAGIYTYATYFINSFIMVIPTTLLTIASSALVAYGFARFNFPFKKQLFAILFSTLMLPNSVIIIPRYVLFNKFGWVDSYMPFWVPALLACYPFFIYQLIQFMRGIPRDLDEAAMLDGANLIQQIRTVEWPAIKDMVVIQFILQAGNIMSIGFEKAYALQTDLNLNSAEIIATYVYKKGLLDGDYSFSTAVGLFNTVINVILLIAVNKVVAKMNDGQGL